MTKYISSEFNSSINPEFGNVYVAEHILSNVKDYVLFCSETGKEKFVFLGSGTVEGGTVVSSHVFFNTHKLIKHVKEVEFKY